MLVGLSSVPSMQSVSGLLYSLYRITLVDEYEYAAMVMVDGVMAPLLCGTFLAASSVLCVNLLIALLTDTFQRSEVTVCPHLSLLHLLHQRPQLLSGLLSDQLIISHH